MWAANYYVEMQNQLREEKIPKFLYSLEKKKYPQQK
jgi:hypothetical protein